jgi:hypothetical protein
MLADECYGNKKTKIVKQMLSAPIKPQGQQYALFSFPIIFSWEEHERPFFGMQVESSGIWIVLKTVYWIVLNN